jgi:MFS family permease
MPLIFAQTLSGNYLEVGVLISIIPLIEVIAAIPFGYFVDFGRIKSVAFNGMLALMLVPLLFAINTGLFTAIGVFLLGVGGIGIWIVTNAHVANVFGRKEIKYIGYEFALMGIGWSVGPVLGGFIYGSFGKVALSVMEVLMLAIASFVLLKTLKSETQVIHKKAPKFIRILRIENRVIHRLPPFVLPFLFISFLFSFIAYAIWVSVPLIILTTGSSILAGGIIVGVINIPYIMGEALSGRFYRRGKEKEIVSVCMLFSVVFMIIATLFVSKSIYSLLILLATALFVTVAYVGIFSAIIERDMRDTGEISALSTVSGGLGGALSAVIAGATVAVYGFYVVTGIFCALVIIYVIYLHFSFRKSKF